MTEESARDWAQSLVNPPAEPPSPAHEEAVEVVDRTTRIGGSDIAAVMGLSPWMTPVELWQLKTKRVVKEITPEKERIFKRGHKLEPFIREMVIEKLQDMGLKVRLVSTNRQYALPGKPYIACEIDFELELSGEVQIGDEIVTFDRAHVTGDAKSVTGFARKKWGEVGTDEIPIEYAAQFMYGLGIRHSNYLLGLKSDAAPEYCIVAALRSFDDVDIYWIERDKETIDAMLAKATLFWEEHVMKDVPPDPVNFADVKMLFEKADPLAGLKVCEPESTIVAKVHRLKNIKAAMKDLKENEEQLQFEIAKEIGTNTGLAFNGAPLCTWNNERYGRLDQKMLKEKYPSIWDACFDSGLQRVLRLKI